MGYFILFHFIKKKRKLTFGSLNLTLKKKTVKALVWSILLDGAET